MANGNGNLMDEFEEAFQHCLHVLTKQDRQPYDDDVIKLEVEQTTMNFINLARQIDVFFLQKRFLLCALKPELLVMEENFDLRHELNRKDDIIKKHYESIERWKQLLNDQSTKPVPNVPPVGSIPGPGVSGMPPMNPNMVVGPGMQSPMHMQQLQMQQQQQQAHLQQQQQQQQQAAAVQQQRLMMQQSLFMAQNAVSSGSSSGPLSYLEKSTDNLPSGGTR